MFVVGAGIHPFGRGDGTTGAAMAGRAVRAALADAGVTWTDVDYAVGGSNAAGKPDALVGSLGLTGIPFVTVRNGCATGGVALLTAANALRAGEATLALVVGFDKHARGAFASSPTDYGLPDWYARTGLMSTTQFFALKTRRYLHQHGLPERLLAAAAARSFGNGARHPMAWRRTPMTEAEIAGAAPVNPPLTKYMFCSPAAGAVALVLAGADRAADLCDRPVKLAAAVMRTRPPGSFEVYSPSLPVPLGPSPTVEAAAHAFARAGVRPSDVRVAQIQDTDSGSELVHLAETGLCAHGEQAELITDGGTEVDGRLPVNTDGGCLAFGEPIGASGLRQVHEVVRQLQGRAPGVQVPGDPEVGFTQVYGAPGISACTVLTR